VSRDGIRRSPVPHLVSDGELSEFPAGLALRCRRSNAKGQPVVEVALTLPDGRKTTRVAGTSRKNILDALKRSGEELRSYSSVESRAASTLTSKSPLGEVARAWRRHVEEYGYKSKRNQTRRYKPSTLRGFDDFFTAHLAGKRDEDGNLVRQPHPLLKRPIGRIGSHEVRQVFENDWADLSDGVKAKLHQLLTHFFRFAIEKGCIHVNPMADIDGYDSQGQLHDDAYLTIEQMRALLGAVLAPDASSQVPDVWHPEYFAPHLKMALFAGLRLNELLSLRWGQVVFSDEPCASYVTVVGQLEGEEVVSPKSGAGSRRIHLTDDLAADLQLHRSTQMRHAEHNAARHARKHGTAAPEPNPRDLVFTSPWGRQLNEAQFRKVIRKIARAAGITVDVHPHLLRHTALTYWADAVNGNDKVFKHIVGHANRSVTDRYVGVPRGALIAATSRFQRQVAQKVI
jgi:integrase